MSRLFISYAHVDKRQVRELAEILADGGHEAWFDHGLVVGRDWKEQLLEEITRCDAFVYALTPESVASEWCQWEFEQAVLLGKPIIPVLIQKNTTLPDALKRYQYADFSDGPNSKATAKLLHGVYTVAVTVPREALSKILVEPAGIPEKAKPDIPPPSVKIRFDISKAMTAFYEARKNRDWVQATDLLDEIEASDDAPAWFKPEQLRSEIQLAIEQDEAEHRQNERQAYIRDQYNLIKLMAVHDSPTRVWQALQEFWRTFSYYDPDNLTTRFRPRTPEQQKLLDIIADPNTKPPERAEAGRQLAAMGDPRVGVGLRHDDIPDIDWVEIPAGEFIFGGDEKAANGLPRQRLYLDAFSISRYPVTYAQFQAFVEAKDGIQDNRWWEELAIQQKDSFEQQWPVVNHPRENVSWYQAVAFCQWLSAKVGYAVTLPTEQQWEKAARGADGRFYPWGNEYISGYANINETYENEDHGIQKAGPYYLQQTTAVGIYSQGVSPYGVLDMAGNVWEWTLTDWDNINNNSIDGSRGRVLRGASWDVVPQISRVASRLDTYQSFRFEALGFRVVHVPPSR